MLRDVDINEISDGKYYTPQDMVMVGCDACKGCSDCCKNTGDSIVLDPFDMYRLTNGLHKSFEAMMEHEIELRMVDQMILPNLMEHDEAHPEKEDGCPFLGSDGRCTIHAFRPGFCRLFPVGRLYNESGMHYFVQVHECSKSEAQRYPVKLEDWIDTPDLPSYERFILIWHDFLKEIQHKTISLPPAQTEQIARYILQIFYVMPYTTDEKGDQTFYTQFEKRIQKVKTALVDNGILS